MFRGFLLFFPKFSPISTKFLPRGPFNWVSGRRVDPVDSPSAIRNLEPRTGKLLSEVPVSGRKEVDRAVEAAAEAFPGWSSTPAAERGAMLREAARLIRARTEELARMDVVDNGKPVWEARVDLDTVTASLDYYGGLAPAILGWPPYPKIERD